MKRRMMPSATRFTCRAEAFTAGLISPDKKHERALMTSSGTSQDTAILALATEIESWLKDHLASSGGQRFVLGLSGGIDSALVCGLAARAVGPERAVGVLMPSSSNPEDAVSAHGVADTYGTPTITVDLAAPTNALRSVLPDADDIASTVNSRAGDMASTLDLEAHEGASAAQLADANLKPRLRMATLYYVANLCGGIVLGTGNKSEAMIGYFTKYGDGGVDLLPIVDLYKHEVRAMALAIGVPESVVQRPPSAGLWEGQTDEDEIGISYDELDAALIAISSGSTEEIDTPVLEKVKGMLASSQHKRAPIPAFRRS